MNDELQQPCQNSDRELWREREGDFYANSIHVTQSGGIGINVGGHVFVKSLEDWNKLARDKQESAPAAEQLSAEQVWFQAACSGMWYMHPGAAASVCAIKMGNRRWTLAPNGYLEEKPHDPTPLPAPAEDTKCPKCGNVITPVRECWACHTKIPAAEHECTAQENPKPTASSACAVCRMTLIDHRLHPESFDHKFTYDLAAQEKPEPQVKFVDTAAGKGLRLVAQEKPVAASVDVRSLLKYISETPALLSLLYDTNLLPEQTSGTRDYSRTLLIADAWRAALASASSPSATTR